MSSTFSTTDGRLFSFASAELDANGKTIVGASSLGFKEELTPSEEYGNGPLPVGRTIGIYKGSAEMEIILSEFNVLIGMVGSGFGARPFNIGATYIEVTGPGILPIIITGARIAAYDLSNSNDGKATRVKMTLSIISPISIDGKKIVDDGGFGVDVGFEIGISL